MKNHKIILAILASCVVLGNAHAQSNTSTKATKATASLIASCQISAQNANFGSLVLPLSAQSTTANLSVLCNKGASYTIDMTYGGVYGQGYPGSEVYYYTGGQCDPTHSMMFGYDVVTGARNDVVCSIPTGSVQGTDGGYYTGAPVSYNYGKMMGAAKGDNIAYTIEVPGKPGVAWNTTNKYTAVGTGVAVSVPVKTTLVPNQSGRNYPIPDVYSDTVTTKITF